MHWHYHIPTTFLTDPTLTPIGASGPGSASAHEPSKPVQVAVGYRCNLKVQRPESMASASAPQSSQTDALPTSSCHNGALAAQFLQAAPNQHHYFGSHDPSRFVPSLNGPKMLRVAPASSPKGPGDGKSSAVRGAHLVSLAGLGSSRSRPSSGALVGRTGRPGAGQKINRVQVAPAALVSGDDGPG